MKRAINILLIDDNPDDRALAVRELRREFPELFVREVADAKELSLAMQAGGWDAVITDFQLLWSDGLAVLQAVKAQCPDCPVLMFTGTGSEEVHREGITLEGQERSYDALGTFTYEDVVVPIPGSVPPYPISGTITRTHTVTVTTPDGTRVVPTMRSSFARYYENVRDVLLGKAELAVTPYWSLDVMRGLLLAIESSRRRCVLPWPS